MTPPDKMHAEFEAWLSEDWLRRYDAGPSWEDVWQAAAALYERRGLERAREICKRLSSRYDRTQFDELAEEGKAALDCADAIEREIGKC